MAAKTTQKQKELSTPELLQGKPKDLKIPTQPIPSADGEGEIVLRFKPDVTMAFMEKGWAATGIASENQREFIVTHAFDDVTEAALNEAYDEENPNVGGLTLRAIAGALHKHYLDYAKDIGILRVNDFSNMTKDQLDALLERAQAIANQAAEDPKEPTYDPEVDGGPDPLSSASPE